MCKEKQSHHSTSSRVVLIVLYCDRSQKTSQRVKNNSHTTQLHLMLYFLFFTRCDVICDLLQYTRTEKCDLFVKYTTQIKIQLKYISKNIPFPAKTLRMEKVNTETLRKNIFLLSEILNKKQ